MQGADIIMITIILKSVDNLSLVYCRNRRLEPFLNQLIVPMMQLLTVHELHSWIHKIEPLFW